jgi:hypothetical protein
MFKYPWAVDLENMAMPSARSRSAKTASGHLTPGRGERSNHQKGVQRATCHTGFKQKKARKGSNVEMSWTSRISLCFLYDFGLRLLNEKTEEKE